MSEPRATDSRGPRHAAVAPESAPPPGSRGASEAAAVRYPVCTSDSKAHLSKEKQHGFSQASSERSHPQLEQEKRCFIKHTKSK